MATIFIDFDGTIVTSKWPDVGTPFPGAAEAVRALMDEGHSCTVFSVRANRVHPGGKIKTPAEFIDNYNQIRDTLDGMGLEGVNIYSGDKPLFHVLIDDRAIRFPGRKRSWRTMPVKIEAYLNRKK
jgi:hypothetical protein